MVDINTQFCRTLLKLVMAEIKPMTTVRERKAAWVYNFGREHWEFHGPNGFYWHGRAYDAYEARAKGWEAWRKQLAHDATDMKARLQGQQMREQLAKSNTLRRKL